MSKEAKTEHNPVAVCSESHTQTAATLSITDEAYRVVFQNIGIGIALISPRMEIITVNNRMKKWYPNLDVSQKPICYKSFNDPPRDQVCSYCPVNLTLQDGFIHESLTETPSRSRTRNFRLIASPVKDDRGNVIAVIEMVEDLTEQVKANVMLETSENMYRTLFENTGTINMLLEEDTTVALVNAQFEKQTGFTKQEVEGRMSFLKWIPDQYRDTALSYHVQRRKEVKSIPQQYEIKMNNKHGEMRNVFVTVDMIPGTKRSIASLIDITALRQAEEAIKKQKEDLEEKARLLEEVNTALKVVLRQRDEDRSEIENKMLTNVKELISPYLEGIKKKNKDESLNSCIQTLELNLNNILSPFLKKLTYQYAALTPREIQIANLIKDGKSTKEIAEILGCSVRAVEFHRNNIRKTFSLSRSKANLRSYLMSLS